MPSTLTVTDQRQLVITEANSWLGTPFSERACIKKVGIDCGQFLIACYSAAGIPVPSVNELPFCKHGWSLNKDDERYYQIITKFAKPVSNPEPGIICMLRIGRSWAHSAIIVDWPMVIHASPAGVQLSNVNQIPRMGKDRLFLSPWV